MANKQISQLTAKPTPVASTDQFGIDDNASDSWKITVANLQTYFTALYLTLSGGTMTGNLVLNGDPSTNLMAATKQYVDNIASGLNVQPSCRMATTVALTVTYNNGASGVGATLTNAGAQAAFSLDGITAALNDRVLIKNQAAPAQNGIYTVTTLGSGASNWVLTRATDYDTVAEITPGDFVLVLSGTANAQTQWVQTSTVVTVGTTSIVWDQFGADINALILGIQNSTYVYSEDTGAADAYVATLAPAISAYVEGNLVILDVANANTGASTINVNGLGAKSIVTEQNGALLAGDLVAGRRAWLLYDGTSYRLVNRNIEKRIQNDSFNYILDTGAADVYVATLVPAVSAYVAGQRLSLKIANANATTTPTVNVNGLGAKTIIHTNGNALVAGDMPAGMIAELRYDGTNYQLQNPAKVLTRVNVQLITATGTFTPTAGAVSFVVEGQAGGGGSGGVACAAANSAASGSGGGGGYFRKCYTAAEMGANAAVTIGAAGAAGSAGANNGTAGGNTVFDPAGTGATCTANGGALGQGCPTQTGNGVPVNSGAGGTATGGDLNITGQDGEYPIIWAFATGVGQGGAGGDSFFGKGGQAGKAALGSGVVGQGYGAGAGGAFLNANSTQAGAAGIIGVVVVTEYISA